MTSDAGPSPLSLRHDDERSRLLRPRPPAQVLASVEAASGSCVTGVRTLRGGSSSTMHVLHLRSRRGEETVVLRRYVLPKVLAEEPGIPRREGHVLELLKEGSPRPRSRCPRVPPVRPGTLGGTGVDARAGAVGRALEVFRPHHSTPSGCPPRGCTTLVGSRYVALRRRA